MTEVAPKLSLIMAVYNAGGLVRQSVQSLLTQSFSDFELIVIDDGSTDDTAQVSQDCAAADARIRLVTLPENVGLTKALNKGLALARGQYIARLDADDTALPGRLARQVEMLDAHSDIVLCGGVSEDVYEDGAVRHWTWHDEGDLRARLFFQTPFPHGSVMMRADAVRAVGGYDERYQTAQDFELWMRMSAQGRVVMLPQPLIRRHVLSGSISHARRWRQAWDSMRARLTHNPVSQWGRAFYYGGRAFIIHALPLRILNILKPASVRSVCDRFPAVASCEDFGVSTPSMSSKRPRLFWTGGDEHGWALAEDERQTALAVRDMVHFTALDSAEIMHSVYWETLAAIAPARLKNKTVICNLSGAWDRYVAEQGGRFLRMADRVDMWVVRSRAAAKSLQALGRPCTYIPYSVDTAVFRPVPDDGDAAATGLIPPGSVPDGSYMIGNFMRDSEGRALHTPKMAKGPDIFVEILTQLHRRNMPVCAVLAGPRRHWIRAALRANNVPCVFVGEEMEGDDIAVNILPRPALNALYNKLDLYLVTSRSEAGPHALLEAAAAGCAILSSRVGIAPDVLPDACLYKDAQDAVMLIEQDIKAPSLRQSARALAATVRTHYTPDAVKDHYQALYEKARAAGQGRSL